MPEWPLNLVKSSVPACTCLALYKTRLGRLNQEVCAYFYLSNQATDHE